MSNKRKIILALFKTMLKIGIFTFGGGYAMLALLENEFVNKKSWVTKEEYLEMTAIVGAAPGSIAINASTFIGYKMAGMLGSFIATLAVCMPSFLIIYVISLIFEKFLTFTYVAYAFRGIQICVIYLIGSAGANMFLSLKRNAFTMIIFGLTVGIYTLCALLSFNLSTVIYILVGGVVGVLISLITRNKERRSDR